MQSDWIQTLNANAFDYDDLLRGVPQSWHLEEIAYILAAKYRYGGHTRPLISVGEHSLRVAHRVHQLTGIINVAACGLMHDAPETMLGDVNRPLKSLFKKHGIDLYTRLEDEAERQIAERFGLTWTDEIRKIVKQADNEACAWEKEYILGPGPRDETWGWLPELPEDCSTLQVFGHNRHDVKILFLRECVKLGVR